MDNSQGTRRCRVLQARLRLHMPSSSAGLHRERRGGRGQSALQVVLQGFLVGLWIPSTRQTPGRPRLLELSGLRRRGQLQIEAR